MGIGESNSSHYKRMLVADVPWTQRARQTNLPGRVIAVLEEMQAKRLDGLTQNDSTRKTNTIYHLDGTTVVLRTFETLPEFDLSNLYSVSALVYSDTNPDSAERIAGRIKKVSKLFR